MSQIDGNQGLILCSPLKMWMTKNLKSQLIKIVNQSN